MLNKYPLWKYLTILFVIGIASLYALPNLYGTDPALQIAAHSGKTVDEALKKQVQDQLEGAHIAYRRMSLEQDGLLVRFGSVEQQLQASEVLRATLGVDYTIAQNLASASPSWLRSINAMPMYLGLDLRGGLHFLMEVDTESVLQQKIDDTISDVRTLLREKDIRAMSVVAVGNTVVARFNTADLRDAAQGAIHSSLRELTLTDFEQDGSYNLRAVMSPQALHELYKQAVEQNITTLRNRVNELGVAEPVIQQQGDTRIVVQLPGIQDSARAKEILSATATLEFRLVDEHLAQAMNGQVPPGTRLYKERDGRPVLLKKRVIITGERINSASSGIDQDGRPSVNISLDGAGARVMGNTTKENIGKPMAVVFIENKPFMEMQAGKPVEVTRRVEQVINVATIQGVFSNRFQITGLRDANETRDLALLLRAGALAAPIKIIEERTVGPSLGQDNIDKGVQSMIYGTALVMLFMFVYYRGFGMVANTALLLNVVLIVAALSMLQATLTLPGIAGIVLTVGMAVDANVLIFERIREELRVGNTPQASIHAGYEKAFATIFDSNITTLIPGVVLFIFGSGPVKGFAVTLSIGILTSMFTAITVTRAIVNLVVGGRRIKTLSI